MFSPAQFDRFLLFYWWGCLLKVNKVRRRSGPNGSLCTSQSCSICFHDFRATAALSFDCVCSTGCFLGIILQMKLELSMQSYVKSASEIINRRLDSSRYDMQYSIWNNFRQRFFNYYTSGYYYELILIKRLLGLFEKCIYYTAGALKWTR